ncbi:MAG: methylated-DNA--[protein]-cysteine S-methyltransferase [Bacteroidetes bacterium]|nr:methylated-DNA--[protein]-cysteine S-methyltransferase [Bacteroidota bacterium]
MENKLFQKHINSPIGWLKITTSDNSLVGIYFIEQHEKDSIKQPEILKETEIQLKEYFEGKRKIFQLQLNPSGTEFQKKVWNWEKNISFGETVSYLEIAIQTGSEKNTRAVGMANGKNPIPIVIPCHRVIGSNGKLTGYAGGLEKKRWLLQHEILFSEKSNLLF